MKEPKNETEKVDEFMKNLKHDFKKEIEEVRKIILKADSKLMERVKWNAPSFFYKYDFAAFNLHEKNKAMLVLIFPKGIVGDDLGVTEGDYKDRRLMYFQNMDDVKSKKSAIEKIVKQWIALVD